MNPTASMSVVLAIFILVGVSLTGCGSAKLKVNTSGQGVGSSSVTSASPVLAKSGDVVTLTGSGLDSGSSYKAVFSPSVSTDVTVVDSTTAIFVMPSGLGLGEKSFSMAKGEQSIGSLSMISAADGAIEVYSNNASLVCSTDSFFNKTGEVTQGTRNCGGAAVADCTADGQQNCVNKGVFKATDTTNLAASNIKSGVTIAGVTGDYTGSGGTEPNPWDLRAGVTVGSTTGKLQVNCRNGATLATYDQGVPQTVTSIDTSTDVLTAAGHGYSDNQTVRINYKISAPGGLSYNTTYYIRDATADTFKLVTAIEDETAIDITTSGDSIMVYAYQLNSGTVDIWDTIDDYYGWASAYPSSYSGWDSTNLCGGIEAALDDDNVWKDVTGADADQGSFKDKISGLEWHKADSTGRNWSAAQAYCDNLNYNGHTDWRLPTQKELMAAYHNGIASTAGATNWLSLSEMRTSYWSASSAAFNTNTAWSVNLAYGNAYNDTKRNAYRVICVRL